MSEVAPYHPDPLIMVMELAQELALTNDPRLPDLVRQVNVKLAQGELERRWKVLP